MNVHRRNCLGLLGVLGILLICFLLLSSEDATSSVREPEPLRALEDGWYRMEAGERVPVEFPLRVEKEKGGDLTLLRDGLDAGDADMRLSFRGALYWPELYLGEELLYAYEENAFACNDQMRSKLNCVARLPGEATGETLRLVLRDRGDGEFELDGIQIGSSEAILRAHLGDEAVNLILICVMLLIALISLVVHVNMRRIHLTDIRFLNVAIFLLLCALWYATDSPLTPELIGSHASTYFISFLAFMTFGIPIIYFVRNTGAMYRYRSLGWIEALFYLNPVVQGALYLLGVCEMVDMLWATHLLLLGGVCALSAMLGAEYHRTRNKDLRPPLLAFALLGASGMIAIALYWLLGIPFYGLIFEMGILVFIICLLWTVVSHTAANLSFRIESRVYWRLSMQDGLTGLANRRSFDQFCEELEERADEYDNVALVFMDLNLLKHTNDRYGHNAGDELLISAARCIRRCFGEAGTCYRIGGDEFAAILPNPDREPVEWLALLDEHIEKHNLSARYRLSIARGCSLLRDAHGQVKRLSDWKYEADQEMYHNKLLRR